ncbi:MAG: DUF423 domain-containing protein [Planctomycetia bacterium]|nr:DUF423 domain-containing protein [Planctomycetia bacterium]
MTPRVWIVLAGLVGAAGVTLGAFGAHGLREHLQAAGLDRPEHPANARANETNPSRILEKRLADYEAATRYWMYHALALLGIGLLLAVRPSRLAAAAGGAFLAGNVLFSGLLYVIVFGGPRMLGAIVPIGGLLLIAGWLLVAAAGLRVARPASNS